MNAPPEHDAPVVPAAGDTDPGGWLVTFSDLVLQLFAFVIVAVVLQAGTSGMAAAPSAVAAHSPERIAATDGLADGPGWPPRARDDEDGEPAAADQRIVVATVAPAPPEGPETAPPARSDAAVADVASAPPEPAPAVPGDARLAALGRYFEELLRAAEIDDAAQVRVVRGEVVLSLGEAVGFAPGSDEIPAAGRALLDEVRTLAAATPELSVGVSGHTDDRPIRTPRFPSNLELSLARAAAVAHEIVAGRPELESRVFASGYGAERPVASNETDEGRTRNRRVEIRLVPPG